MSNEEAKLFVAGLPDSVSEDVLKQLFEATGGQVAQVSLPKDRTTGRPRGFGFVTMASSAEAQAAREALDGSMQGGRCISVRPFSAEPPRRDGFGPPGMVGGAAGSGAPRMDRGPRPGGPMGAGGPGAASPDRTLYIGNLPYDCSQQEVETLINSATGAEGDVVRVHLPMDPDGRKRGFGFVTMASAETAKAALEALKTGDLRGRRLIVNLAQPKGDRPPRDFSGGGGGGGGGGGYGAPGPGGAPAGGGFSGPPAQQRKTFDDRKRGKGGPPADDGGGPKKNRRQEREDRDKTGWEDD